MTGWVVGRKQILTVLCSLFSYSMIFKAVSAVANELPPTQIL
jgi:hypothetical protein